MLVQEKKIVKGPAPFGSVSVEGKMTNRRSCPARISGPFTVLAYQPFGPPPLVSTFPHPVFLIPSPVQHSVATPDLSPPNKRVILIVSLTYYPRLQHKHIKTLNQKYSCSKLQNEKLLFFG